MPAPPALPRRVDGSMALLVDLMQHAEDPAYADAAAARARSPRPRRALPGVALVLALGVVAGTAVAAVRAGSGDRGPGRAQLAEQVRRRTADSDDLAAQAQRLRADVAARRAEALGGAEAARLAQLELAAATSAVTGPGVVAELDDAPAGATADGALPRGAQAVAGRVLDRDLQRLVNGLWAAGAEAVSVNDLRLTARTAIRSAGQAVLVDYRPLSPPYVVRAVGKPGQLEPAFADGPEGRALVTAAGLYGLRYRLRSEPDLHLPAGTVAALRAATPAPEAPAVPP